MPVLYEKTPYDTIVEGDSLTEQEHLDSCDINKMMKNAARGLDVRGASSTPQYGYDDTTMGGLEHRIQKANLEQQLQSIAEQQEFTEQELQNFRPEVIKKFGFKKKQTPTESKSNDKTNKTDDSTVSNQETIPTPTSGQKNS